ncbi:MAG: RNA polymerase sigma factor [Opitutaceae bacterium]|nr:RNA polymerase sigma factor [Opitutaceae bacterium]
MRDVDDIVQESYLRIWRRQTERPIASIKAFLFTIARRLAIDTSRQQNRSPIEYIGVPAQLDVKDESENVVANVCRAEGIRLLTDAIDTLPRRCREVIILRKIELLSTHEVAKQLGITEHAVENYFTRGTARIRKRLKLFGVKQTMGSEN